MRPRPGHPVHGRSPPYIGGTAPLTRRTKKFETGHPGSQISGHEKTSADGQRSSLGELVKTDEQVRVKRLLDAVHGEVKSLEGAFFGGLLRVRVGDDLQGHARLLLERLTQRNIPSGSTLADSLAYISAMHAQGLEFLSRPVLAKVLGCPLERLRRDVIIPLGNEAAATVTSEFVFTRHRAVAEAVVEVLANDFGEDVELLFSRLAVAAIEEAKSTFVPNLAAWRFRLPQHFFDNGRRSLSVGIAQAIYDADPDNLQSVNNLAKLYREAGQPENALRFFENLPLHDRVDRAVYQEWGTSAGACANWGDSALLLAFSLADQGGSTTVENDRAKLGLAGMGVVFGRMLEAGSDPAILGGLAAVAVLGKQLALDPTTSGHFKRHSEQAVNLGSAVPSVEQALEWFGRAVTAAARSATSPEVKLRVGDSGRLTFLQIEGLTGFKR